MNASVLTVSCFFLTALEDAITDYTKHTYHFDVAEVILTHRVVCDGFEAGQKPAPAGYTALEKP